MPRYSKDSHVFGPKSKGRDTNSEVDVVMLLEMLMTAALGKHRRLHLQRSDDMLRLKNISECILLSETALIF